MTEPTDPQTAVYALSAVGLVVAVGMSVWQWLRRRKAPQRAAEPAPLPEEARCPCGAPATHPLPRARVWEVPLVGRWVRRERDGFGVVAVCELHADVAAAYLDEQIAAARLHGARAERDRLAALANQAAETMATVTQSIPEDARRRARLKPAQVRVLRGDEGGEG
ncbi:MAG: hypothetical protein FJ304_27920 [Planctomycetes bacterium]|nr:hypothetical protein [Planctomycetota bacterium]